MAGIQLGLQRFGVTTPEKEFITVNTTKNSPGARRDFNTGFGKPGAPGATVRYVKDIPNPNYKASAQGSGGSGGSGGPAPNDGQYGNIVSNLDYQAQAAKAQQDYWANKATEDANANAAKAASMEAEKAAAAAATKQQQDALQQMMIQQQTAFAQQQLLQQQQIAASNAAYEEQKRAGDALARAYIPNQQATALAPVVGDERNAISGASTSRNTLSSLSILTGNNSGTNASKMGSLSGLQIA